MSNDENNTFTDTAKLYFKINPATGTVSCKASFSKDISAELYEIYSNAEKVSVGFNRVTKTTCIQKLSQHTKK